VGWYVLFPFPLFFFLCCCLRKKQTRNRPFSVIREQIIPFFFCGPSFSLGGLFPFLLLGFSPFPSSVTERQAGRFPPSSIFDGIGVLSSSFLLFSSLQSVGEDMFSSGLGPFPYPDRTSLLLLFFLFLSVIALERKEGRPIFFSLMKFFFLLFLLSSL